MKKTFKSAIAIVLALSMLAVLAVVSFAGETTNVQTLNENTTSGDATVWYQTDRNQNPGKDDEVIDDSTIGDNYTVTVPERVLATKDATAINTYDVTASDVLIHKGKQLEVTCTYNGALELKGDGTTTIAYKMQVDSTDFATGDAILTVAAGTPSATNTVAVNAVLTAAPLFAGLYEDTCTFTCAVVDAA